MNNVATVESHTILIGMASGARYRVEEVFLHEESKLRRAQALRVSAAGNLNGVSTGIGFWGSPEWAFGGALALGILEGIASNAASKKGMSQLEEAGQLMSSAHKEGAFVPVCNIQNIAVPQPALWRGVLKQDMSKWYAHSGEPFVLVRTSEEGAICLAWDKVESFMPPPPVQLNDEQLMELYGITFNGSLYCYGGYRYTKLADAINFASSQYVQR